MSAVVVRSLRATQPPPSIAPAPVTVLDMLRDEHLHYVVSKLLLGDTEKPLAPKKVTVSVRVD